MNPHKDMAEAFATELSAAINDIVTKKIDELAAGSSLAKCTLALVAGRTLVGAGVTFIGPALGIADGNLVIDRTQEFLLSLKTMAGK